MTARGTAMQPALVTIRLHGHLGGRYGRVHELAVESAAEALRALEVLCEGFAEAVRDWRGAGYRVRVGSGGQARWLDEHTMRLGLGRARRIDIVPSVSGAKRNGVGQLILGTVLLLVGLPGIAATTTSSLGLALVLGGAVALLTPMPKGSDSKAGQEVSRQINGPPNVVSSGGPVPLVIGRVLVGSVTVSAGLSTDQVVIDSTDPGPADLPAEEPVDWYVTPPGGGDGSDA
jgi:predicted phage tail protein